MIAEHRLYSLTLEIKHIIKYTIMISRLQLYFVCFIFYCLFSFHPAISDLLEILSSSSIIQDGAHKSFSKIPSCATCQYGHDFLIIKLPEPSFLSNRPVV